MSTILTIPQELMDHISLWLPASATASLTSTCHSLSVRFSRALHQHAISPVADLPAIHWATRQNKLTLIKRLLAHDPGMIRVRNPENGGTPLHTAVTSPTCVETISLLLEFGADVNVRDDLHDTPMHCLSRDPGTTVEHLHVLLDHGADVNLSDRHGVTPLSIAIENNRDDLALPLIHAGANPDGSSRNGCPLLWDVCSNSFNIKLLEALLAAGADADYTDCTGLTALMLASQSGWLEAVDLLLQHGVDKNALDRHGKSALGMACCYGNRLIALKLIAEGAVCDTGREAWMSPLRNAARRGFLDVVQEILKTGVERRQDVLEESVVVAKRNGHTCIVSLLEMEQLRIGVARVGGLREDPEVLVL